MKVYKFGGTSVGTVERMKHVAELISESTPKIVVLSATAGTTNHLEEIAANLFNRDIEQAHEKITRMEFQFIDFANELLTDESTKREAIDYILDRFQRLWQFINDEFTSIEEKEVLAQGELISTALLHFYLRERKIANILLHFFRIERTWRKRSHTACIQSGISITGSLMILGTGHSLNGLSVNKGKN